MPAPRRLAPQPTPSPSKARRARAQLGLRFQREGDPLPVEVDFQHRGLDALAHLHYIARLLHERVGELAHVVDLLDAVHRQPRDAAPVDFEVKEGPEREAPKVQF